MFEIGRVFWLLAYPPRVAFLLLGLGVLLLFTRRWRLGRALLAGLVGISLLLGAVSIGDHLLHRIEQRFPRVAEPPPRVDGIILLGGELNASRTLQTGQPVITNASRLLAFADLARRHPEARLVFTGGSGSLFDKEANEARAMPVVLRAIGIDPARVAFESRSRNTYENAIYTREVVAPKEGEVWLLVTSAFHMPRSVGVFRKAGMQVIAYPTGHLARGSFDWDALATFDVGFRDLVTPGKELIGLLAYRMLGYTDTLFPAP
jgi:uncharacterized SAM-binding protein YcdF (DUF218 family)